MQIKPTTIVGVYVIECAKKTDDRGAFFRTWDRSIASQHGLQESFDYMCISTNHIKYTLRGMHWQRKPHSETKLVRCAKGSIFDVALDLRPASPTFRQWFGIELAANSHRALYIPEGCAHGFLTMEDATEILYSIAGEYEPSAAHGARWNDPAFNIRWPVTPKLMSTRDASYPLHAS